MTYQDIDKKAQEMIISALYERRTINANKEIGAAYFQAETEDKLNPSVLISRDDIKELTHREKVRDVVLDDYAKSLSGWGRTVERVGKDVLKVSIVPEKAKEIEFSSPKKLLLRNKEELDKDPELGEPLY